MDDEAAAVDGRVPREAVERGRTQFSVNAERVTTLARWSDIQLPPDKLTLLHEIAAQAAQHSTVHDESDIRRKPDHDLGISVLFSGESGTGKTLAAEVLANELQLPLYRVDLSAVVSKYIGETEKNLKRLFDAVEDGGGILLLDEADALFGKRSEVNKSHDRYADIEVDYLLQRMENHPGLVILTTKVKSALDPAFVRRLRFIVDFPFPTSEPAPIAR